MDAKFYIVSRCTKRMCRRRPVHPHDQHLLLWGLFCRAPTNLLASGLLPLAGCGVPGKTQGRSWHFFFGIMMNSDLMMSRWWFHFFYFHPYLGKWNPICRSYFSDGLATKPRFEDVDWLVTCRFCQACALVYLLMAIWLSMHASIKSHSYATRLLTRWCFGVRGKDASLFW